MPLNNTSIRYTLWGFLFIVFSWTCVTPESFEVPSFKCDVVNLKKTIDVQTFQDLAFGSAYKLSDNHIVEAFIVSSDVRGNFYKTLSLVSKDGQHGFTISLDRESIHTYFEPGRQIFLKAKGLMIQKRDGEVEIGVAYNGGVGRIDNAIIDTFLVRGCTTIKENDLLQKIKLSQIANHYLNTLVEIDSIQFSALSTGSTYFDANRTSGTGTNHYVEDESGNSLLVRISEFTDFASFRIPQGVGKIRGVLQKFGSDFQLIIRDTTDVIIDRPAKIWGFSSNSISGESRTIKDIRDSFAAGAKSLMIPAYIEGVVTLSANSSNNTGSGLNTYIQDTSAGILLRTTQDTRLLEGYKIRIDLTNAIIDEFRGLLQLSNVTARTKIEIINTDAELPKAKRITLTELLAGTYESQLVLIDNVQFMERPSLFSGSNYITDGNTTALVYTQPSASFANQLVPHQNGTLTAIASEFNSPQLLVAHTEQFISWNNSRIDITSNATRTNLSDVRLLGSSLASGSSTTINENITIKGVVTSDKTKGNIQNQNVIIQDPSAGILVRFTDEPDVQIGDSVAINILGAHLENYNGLLQVNDVKLNSIIETSSGTLPSPIKISMTQLLAGEHQSELIYIDTVQFVQSGTYVQGRNTSLEIENCTEKVTVFIRADALFGEGIINQNKGTIVGVVSTFNSPQLYIRDTTDIQFTLPRETCVAPTPRLMITEVADPKNLYQARFVELYNSGNIAVSLKGWKLVRYTNGGTKGSNINLSDVNLAVGGFFVIANSASFNNKYPTRNANQLNTSISFNGDDVVELVDPEGNLVDVFGTKGEDGTGTAWDYLDGRASRQLGISSPNTTFTVSEWNIIKGNQDVPADFNPGVR